MSNHPLLTDLCIRIDKLFKIWLFGACFAVLDVCLRLSWGTSDGKGAVWFIVGLIVVLVLMFFDFYLRRKSMADLSKILSNSTSEQHKNIEVLKKIFFKLMYISAIIVITTILLGRIRWFGNQQIGG